jgi:hypothetical protein
MTRAMNPLKKSSNSRGKGKKENNIFKSKLLAYIIVEILGALAGFYAYNIFVSNTTNKE